MSILDGGWGKGSKRPEALTQKSGFCKSFWIQGFLDEIQKETLMFSTFIILFYNPAVSLIAVVYLLN